MKHANTADHQASICRAYDGTSTNLANTAIKISELLSIQHILDHTISDFSISQGPLIGEESFGDYLDRCRASMTELTECLFDVLPSIKVVLDSEFTTRRETKTPEDKRLLDILSTKSEARSGDPDIDHVEVVSHLKSTTNKQEMIQEWLSGSSDTKTLLGSSSIRDDRSLREDASVVDTKDVPAFQPDDEYGKMNSALQVAWANMMAQEEYTGAYTYSAYYKKVSVLMISWDPAYDDLGTKAEVDALAEVFKNIYNFEVRISLLGEDRRRPLQQTVNKIVANWIYENDTLNSLLIVYFAGYGTPGLEPGTLQLSGQMRTRNHSFERDIFIWNQTESLLLETGADVLEIFDCCYAGDLGTTRAGTRTFECLAAATKENYTQGPGKRSFTAALIWALHDLAMTRFTFTTSQLLMKISTEAPHFPKTQSPVLYSRGRDNRIMLRPLPSNEAGPGPPLDAAAIDLKQEVLTLKFVFDMQPTAEEIKGLAHELNASVRRLNLPMSQIRWGGLVAIPRGKTYEVAARRFAQAKDAHDEPLRRAQSDAVVRSARNAPLKPVERARVDYADLADYFKSARFESAAQSTAEAFHRQATERSRMLLTEAQEKTLPLVLASTKEEQSSERSEERTRESARLHDVVISAADTFLWPIRRRRYQDALAAMDAPISTDALEKSREATAQTRHIRTITRYVMFTLLFIAVAIFSLMRFGFSNYLECWIPSSLISRPPIFYSGIESNPYRHDYEVARDSYTGLSHPTPTITGYDEL